MISPRWDYDVRKMIASLDNLDAIVSHIQDLEKQIRLVS